MIKAEEDLTAAAQILKLGRTCPTAIVCFHAQQCAEKYLKAYLVCSLMAFQKTHDMEALIGSIPEAIPTDSAAARSSKRIVSECALGRHVYRPCQDDDAIAADQRGSYPVR